MQSPDLPAPSQSLYRLSYPTHICLKWWSKITENYRIVRVFSHLATGHLRFSFPAIKRHATWRLAPDITERCGGSTFKGPMSNVSMQTCLCTPQPLEDWRSLNCIPDWLLPHSEHRSIQPRDLSNILRVLTCIICIHVLLLLQTFWDPRSVHFYLTYLKYC